jgi:hypothetical protein
MKMIDITPNFLYVFAYILKDGPRGMKKLTVISIALILFLAIPAGGEASYRILLKNGGEFKTDRYWKEGSQIRFDIYGGVAGVQKASVRKIERIAAPATTVYGPRPVHQKAAQGSLDTEGIDNEKKQEKVDIAQYLEKKERLTDELARALENVRKAASGRDPEARKRAEGEMRRLSGEITALTEEVKGKNNGALPEGWLTEK